MILFSKKIEALIIESGETVQSLAEMGVINRTNLQRIKSGYIDCELLEAKLNKRFP